MRQITEQEAAGLKTVVGLAVKAVGGGAIFQGATRVLAPELSKYASRADERHMPIDVAIDLDRVSGEPSVTRHMAGLLGYDLKPRERAPGVMPDAQAMASATSECLDVFRVWAEALADDGEISHAERVAIQREIQQAIRALTDISDQIGRAR
ncbi:MAG: hypothetical protein CML29_17360 [Rhizobiales bacterium]|nr:hypothetical protein [Hyphomicrobiales bacterium]MBA68650.1 hypothetical protein [Hyphomicrobiales bacterium]